MATLREYLSGRSRAEVELVASMCGYATESLRVTAITGRVIPIPKALLIYKVSGGEVELGSLNPEAVKFMTGAEKYIKGDKAVMDFMYFCANYFK